MHLRYESAGLRTVRAAGRVYIIIPDAGYTYLYKEGFTCCGPCARGYPPRYLYGLLQRFRQLRDQRRRQGGGEEKGEGAVTARPSWSAARFYLDCAEAHNCFDITARMCEKCEIEDAREEPRKRPGMVFSLSSRRKRLLCTTLITYIKRAEC